MPESRHRTTIEIKAESRDVKNLGKELERTFDPRHIEAFEKALTRSAEVIEKLTQQQAKLSEKLEKAGRAKPPPLPGASRARQTWERKQAEEDRRNRAHEERQQRGGRGGPGFGTIFGGTAAGTFAGHAMYGGMQRAGNLTAAVAQGEGAINAALEAIPVLGGTMSAAVERAQQLYQYFLAEQEAVGQAYGATGARGLGRFKGEAQRFGVAGPQAAGMLGGFGQAARMEGAELMQAAPEFIEAQKLFGVDLAGLVGAGRAAGGITRGPEAELQIAMKEGVKAGFEFSEMPRYFQSMIGTLTDIRERGIDTTIGNLEDLVSFFGTRGVKGGAAMRAAQGVAGGGINIEQESIGAALSYMAARRAIEKGHAENRLQEYGLDFPSIGAFIEKRPKMLMEEIEQDPALAGKSEAFKAFMYRQVTNLPWAASREIAKGQRGWGDIGEEKEASERAREFMDRRRAGTRATFGAAAHAAERINRQAEIGGRAAVQKAVKGIQDFELSLTETLIPTIEGFASRVETAATVTLENIKNMKSALDIPGILLDFGQALYTGEKPKQPKPETPEEAVDKAQARAQGLAAEATYGAGAVTPEAMSALVDWVGRGFTFPEKGTTEGDGAKGAAAHLRKSAEHTAKAAIILETFNIEGVVPTDLEVQ